MQSQSQAHTHAHSVDYMRGFAAGVAATKKETLREVEWLKAELNIKMAERVHTEQMIKHHIEQLATVLPTSSAGRKLEQRPGRLSI